MEAMIERTEPTTEEEEEEEEWTMDYGLWRALKLCKTTRPGFLVYMKARSSPLFELDF